MGKKKNFPRNEESIENGTNNGYGKNSGNQNNRGNSGRRSRGGRYYPPKSSMHNSPEWYAAIPQMVKDAATISFAEAIGRPIENVGTLVSGGANNTFLMHTVPGICTLGYVPGVGVSTNAVSPINIIGAANYAYIRSNNSGAKNWSQNTGTLYLIGGASLFALWADMTRALGLMNRYDIYNRYVGDHLLEALGYDARDFRAHQSDFRAFINQFAFKLGSICFPASMSYISRQLQLAGNVYKDAVGIKSQLYAYVPEVFYSFSELEFEAGAYLKPCSRPPKFTFEDLRVFATDMVDSFLQSESVMIISGDMKKAYDNAVMMLTTIGENYTFEFKDVAEISTQIMNYKGLGHMSESFVRENPIGDWSNTPASWILADNDTNTVYWNPVIEPAYIGAQTGLADRGNYVNLPMDAPSPDDVMVATRMQPIAHLVEDGSGEKFWEFDTLGSELPTVAKVWYIHPTRGFESTEVPYYSVADGMGSEVALNAACQLSAFTAHPLTLIVNRTGVTDGYEFIGMLGDIRNLAFVPRSVYEKANNAALLSEFYNPNLGAFLKTN